MEVSWGNFIFRKNFFRKVECRFHHIFDHFRRKTKMFVIFSGNNPLGGHFSNFIFRKNSFRRVGFNICSTILGQKTKIENFGFFRKFSKSWKRANFFKLHFSQTFFQESKFQCMFDLFTPKNKNRKFWEFSDF